MSEKVYGHDENMNEINIKSKILWTNPNPDAEFAAQTITLNSDDYDVLEWFFKPDYSSNQVISSRHIKGNNAFLGHVFCGTEGSTTRDRNITRNSDVSYSVGDGRVCYTGSTARKVGNNVCVPIYIVGHKTGLF